MPHNLVFLLRYAGLTGDSHCREMAEKLTDAMYRAGSTTTWAAFSRYSTDDHWLAPPL